MEIVCPHQQGSQNQAVCTHKWVTPKSVPGAHNHPASSFRCIREPGIHFLLDSTIMSVRTNLAPLNWKDLQEKQVYFIPKLGNTKYQGM